MIEPLPCLFFAILVFLNQPIFDRETTSFQRRMLWTNARIVQAGGDTMRLLDLAWMLFVLMQNDLLSFKRSVPPKWLCYGFKPMVKSKRKFGKTKTPKCWRIFFLAAFLVGGMTCLGAKLCPPFSCGSLKLPFLRNCHVKAG